LQEVYEVHNDIIAESSIPTEIGLLNAVKTFSLYNVQQLVETIPAEISAMTSLENLYLWPLPQIGGSMPPELGTMTKLTRLYIAVNRRIQGSIPPELGNLAKLNRLWLFSNANVVGTILEEFGYLNNAEHIRLHINSLTGPVPSSFTNLVANGIASTLKPGGFRVNNNQCLCFGDVTATPTLLTMMQPYSDASIEMCNTALNVPASDPSVFGGDSVNGSDFSNPTSTANDSCQPSDCPTGYSRNFNENECLLATCSRTECCTEHPRCAAADCGVGTARNSNLAPCEGTTCTEEECCGSNPTCASHTCTGSATGAFTYYRFVTIQTSYGGSGLVAMSEFKLLHGTATTMASTPIASYTGWRQS
jgi:hypothetical protein